MSTKSASSRKALKDLEGYRKHNIGWLVVRIQQDFFDRARIEWQNRGYENLQNAFGSVITRLPLEGARLTDLATSAGVTKQAMGQVVDELEKVGYVERTADPTDGRAKMVRFTKSGLEMIGDAREVVAEVWSQYEALIGAKRLTRIRDDLDLLVNSIESEGEFDEALESG